MDPKPIVVERLLNADVATVWKAITDRDEMAKWYFDLAEFQARVGFTFQFTAGDPAKPYVHYCKITEVVPEKKLSYTWRFEGDPGVSLVSFGLFKQGDQTRIVLTHTGVETFSPDDPALDRMNFVGGWEQIIAVNLKSYLEGGKVS
ncbi:MAG TPA: SRPBCC domain-containing protein [Arachidicoccus sp.]|nr:SRPBCC domain-containing protein [Arachidicoccus sp.]